MDALIESLSRLIGSAHVLLDAASTEPYEVDWRGRYRGNARCVVRPSCADEVASVVSMCAQAGVPVVPQGGNTGLVGGGVPRSGGKEVLLSLSRLDKVRALDATSSSITVEAGCTLAKVQAVAAEAGYLFPLSLASEGSCQIGGNLASNAGGVHVLRFGNMRDLVLGLEVVLPDGRIWNGLRVLRKDNTGYDLKQLFIGSEGTLGVITAAVLKLFPAQRRRAVAWVAVPDVEAAVSLLAYMRERCGERLNAFELIGEQALTLVLRHIPDTRMPLSSTTGWQLLVELADAGGSESLDGLLESVLEDAMQKALLTDAACSANEAQSHALWALRENISEAQKREGFSVKHDISLPVSHIAAFLKEANASLEQAFPGVRVVCFGHLGDGNLHYNMSKPASHDNADFIERTSSVNRIVHDLVAAHGGSISAEHGIGQLKREELRRYKSEEELDLMRAIKAAIDPAGIMNPGKLI